MHDPMSLFAFDEHNIFIPMVVLEELDHAKRGLSEVNRNVRQVSRFLDDIIRNADRNTINEGLPLSNAELVQKQSGHLYFQTHQFDTFCQKICRVI